jgi:fructokinase
VPIRIGIDVGGTKIEGVALDGSEEIARTRVETPRENYAATLEAIVRLVATLEQQARANPKSQIPSPKSKGRGPGSRTPNPESRLPTVGVGIPGALSPSTGRVKNANSTWLIGQKLEQDLELRLGRPVRIANDANCFAVSEAADGSGAGAEVVFAVIVGTGTGAGIVVRGQLVTGPNAIAGEWGHNPLPWAEADEVPGPPCYCGRRGCVETFLSGPGMALDHRRRTSEQLLPPEIVERAAAGEQEAEVTLTRYERRMARALAGVINVLDPDVIVLGGGMSNIERLYVNVPCLWAEFVFAAGESRVPNPESGVQTRLVRARHGDASGVRGAAWLWPAAPWEDRCH